VRALIARRLPELDRIAGAAVGALGERFYTWFRTKHAEYMALTLGDLLVYQRHGDRIRARVRAEIEARVPGAGRDPEHAVHLVGHSLGAVIALDLVTAADPVHTAGLVTFGCQWPLFHLVDPRGGQLSPYHGDPVRLPPSLRRWTNLWHPLDPLAFVAERLFRLDDPHAVTDVRVEHLFSEQLYTHSTYWTNPELVAALTATFDERHFP
jgi:pimeloyl-ACP methyl ester carboxylesterase